MSNYMGFVYSMSMSGRDRRDKPLSEQEIILQQRAAATVQPEKPGLARRITDLVRGSIDRLTSPAEEHALEKATSQR